MRDLVMGIDVGTTNAKALIVDAEGNILSQASANYGVMLPRDGWAEQNPEDLWLALRKVVKESAEKIGPQSARIAALALSTQRDTMIAADSNGRAVRNAITWMDSRAAEQCAELERFFGHKRVYNITGVPISTIWTLAFIMWMRDNEKEPFNRAACFGLVEDYLLCRMGASGHVIDTSSACQTMMFDINSKQWSAELIGFAGIDASRLPRLAPPGTTVGQISEEFAIETGLPSDTLLVLGAGDQQCATLGAGVIKPGDISLSIGTASNILAPVASKWFDPDCRVLCHIGAAQDMYVLETALLATGATMEWVRRAIYGDMPSDEFFTAMNREAALSPVGAGGLILVPHFAGAGSPYWDADARGVIAGLRLATERGDIARAVMEGVALELRKNIEMLKKPGVRVNRVVVTGGAARSKLWMSILADVLGKAVETPRNTECAALGAAALAALGAGIIDEVGSASRRISISARYEPDPNAQKCYDVLYGLHSKTCDALREKQIFAGYPQEGY